MKPFVANRKDAALSKGVRDRRKTPRMCRSGNLGTRRDMMPRNRVTVCAGTNWEKATRNEICKGMVPLMEVKLGGFVSCGRYRQRMTTYVQRISPVTAKRVTKVPKHSILGIKAATSRNFANSAEGQALSKYLPP